MSEVCLPDPVLILAHRPSAQWLPHDKQPFIGSSLADSPSTHSRKNEHTQRQQRTRGEKQHIQGDKSNFASRARLTPQTRGSSSHQAESGSPSVHQRNTYQNRILTLVQRIKSYLPRINKILIASPGKTKSCLEGARRINNTQLHSEEVRPSAHEK